MERLICYSLLGAVTGFAVAVELMVGRSGVGWFLLAAWSGVIAWYVFSVAALAVTRTYAEQVKATFDVYRKDLRAALDMGEFADDAERRTWGGVSQFWYRGLPTTTVLESEPGAPESTEEMGTSEPRAPLVAVYCVANAVFSCLGIALLV